MLKIDSLGGAFGARPLSQLRLHFEDFGGAERCTVIGGEEPIVPPSATAPLVRYLDFNDSYLAQGEPSDNLASVLATAEYAARAVRSS